MSWQHINTAPKDGTRIQLARIKSHVFETLPDVLWIKIGSWRAHYQDGYEEGWREDAVAASSQGHLKLVPSHWCYVPDASAFPPALRPGTERQ